MNIVQKRILVKQDIYNQSLSERMDKVIANRCSDDDEAFETRLNAFARWCFSCGREIGTIEGYELGENNAPIWQTVHLN